MRLRTLLTGFLALLLASIVSPSLSAQISPDGIPDNCENTRGTYHRDGIFARYEPQNQRLLLVNWQTGADVQVLATGLPDTLIRGWSWDCRYLAVATGTPQSRDTVVYDTTTANRIGSVPDAQHVAHPITWGPGAYLVVETRSGAVIWDVAQNRQYHYDTGFHTTLHRNFTQLRWDNENNQFIGNLAVGGRLVVDLTTGEETVIAGSQRGEIIVGGERFICADSASRGNQTVYSLQLRYEPEGSVILMETGWGLNREIMATVAADEMFRDVGRARWSANCRYLAASIRTQTGNGVIVWEFETRRRIAIFEGGFAPDWDTAEKHLFIQTDEGAYLWNIQTDERILITDYTEQRCDNPYYTDCSNRYRQAASFYNIYWDAGRQQMLGVPLTAPDSVVAYDVNTGDEVMRYTVQHAEAASDENPVQFITSNDSRLLAIYHSERVTIWNRNDGSTFSLDFIGRGSHDFAESAAISTNNRYFASSVRGGILVWDLSNPFQMMTPSAVYNPAIIQRPGKVTFINGDTLAIGDEVRINIVTGDVIAGAAPQLNLDSQQPPDYTAIPGESGFANIQPAPGYFRRDKYNTAACPQLPFYNADDRQLFLHDVQSGELRLIADDINRIRYMQISPDCNTLYTEIALLNTNLPYDETPATESRYWYNRKVNITLWDIASGEPFAVFDSPPQISRGDSRIWWSPNGDRAVLRGYVYTPRYAMQLYTINIREQAVNPIRFLDTEYGFIPRSTDIYWDYARGMIYIEGFGEVFAIDMQTGGERLRFPVEPDDVRTIQTCARSSRVGCNMSIGNGGNWLFVYGDYSLAAWNLNTLEHAYVPVESNPYNVGAQVSPDGRYLIVARSAVRVWDLQNLPDDFYSREPLITFGYGAQSYQSLQFVDATTLQLTIPAEDGVRTVRYNILTGQPVSD